MNIERLDTMRQVRDEVSHSRSTRARLLQELDALEQALRRAQGEAQKLPEDDAPSAPVTVAGTFTMSEDAATETGTFTVTKQRKGWRFPWNK